MGGWLKKFVIAGLIVRENDQVTISSKPCETEIATALKSG